MQTPVGFIVSWKVPSIVKLDDLRSGLARAGLDALELAPDLRPTSLVGRSAKFIAKDSATKDTRKLSRPTADSNARQITAEHVDASGLTYRREAAIAYDETTGGIASPDLPISTLLLAEREVIATRTATDVTRVMQRIVEGAGSDMIPVREGGGAYFIPQGHIVIPVMREVLEAVGGHLTTFACTLGHGSTESVAETITDYMLKQISELQEAVDQLNEGGIRSDVKRARLSRVADLREKVAAYASLVTTSGEKLNRAIDKAEETLLAKLAPTKDEPAAVEVAS